MQGLSIPLAGPFSCAGPEKFSVGTETELRSELIDQSISRRYDKEYFTHNSFPKGRRDLFLSATQLIEGSMQVPRSVSGRTETTIIMIAASTWTHIRWAVVT